MAMRFDGTRRARTSGTAGFTPTSSPAFKPAPTRAGSSAIFTPGGVGGGAPTTPYPARVPAPGTAGTRPAPAPAPSFSPPQAPTPPTRITPSSPLGTSSGGSYGAMSAPSPVAPIEPIPQLGEDEWVAQDSVFTTESTGINAELKNLLAQISQQRKRYDADFGESLDSLGWEGEPTGQGQWDTDDYMGAYGQSFRNQTNDFAGRGMLESSFYNSANDELNRRFNDQRTDMLNARQRQFNDWNTQQTTGESRAKQALDQARASAIARRAAAYGLTGPL